MGAVILITQPRWTRARRMPFIDRVIWITLQMNGFSSSCVFRQRGNGPQTRGVSRMDRYTATDMSSETKCAEVHALSGDVELDVVVGGAMAPVCNQQSHEHIHLPDGSILWWNYKVDYPGGPLITVYEYQGTR